MHFMANYVSLELQAAEQNCLYKNGDALIEILAAGGSVPDKETRNKIRKLAAVSHAKICLALMSPDPSLKISQESIPRIPRLIIDLYKRKLLSREFFKKNWSNIENAYFLNNEQAAAIFEECTQMNFSRLVELEGLLVYQVNLDELILAKHPGMLPIEMINLFRHAANVQEAQRLLEIWRISPDAMKWMTLFQWMVMRKISAQEAEMTKGEETAFQKRIIPNIASIAETEPQGT